ncbi:response regulator [Maricaulis sp. D1M11]|uniref:response regulator n=1 Tax=Maricaulis sp. D1M11 TaxID=3076117 RepID=UPI0039B3AB4D
MTAEHASFAAYKVLIVDDNAALRGALRVTLQALGCAQVIETDNAERALTLLKKQHVDLMITDWKMKPLDGIELVRQLRNPMASPAPYLPVIMLTAYSQTEKLRQARNAGVNDVLVKPFTAEGLARCLRSVLTSNRPFIETETFFGPDRRATPRPDTPAMMAG